MDALTAAMMSIGTGTAAGLRPYFTVAALGLFRMFLPASAPDTLQNAAHLVPEQLASPWAIGLCGLLALTDGTIDKIIGVNLPFEGINQFLRPVFGLLVGLGVGSQVGDGTAAVSGLLGAGTALPVSLGKGSLTAGMTAAFPEPTTQVLRSLMEDVSAMVSLVMSLLAPIVAALLGMVAIAVGVGLFFAFRHLWKDLRQRFKGLAGAREGVAQLREERPAGAVSFMNAMRQAASKR